MDYELNVSLSGPGDYNFDWDFIVDDVMEDCGLKSVGSGMGFGSRDLEYKSPDPLTLEAVQELHERIVPHIPSEVAITLHYSVWPGDELNEDGPVGGFSYPEGIYA